MLGSRNILTSRKLTLMALASCIGIVTFAAFVPSLLRASARTDASLRKVQAVAQRSIHVLKLYPKTVTPPLEFHGLKLNNKPLDFGAVFEDGGDFFERVSFDVTSRADKKAVYIEIMVYFYTQAGVKEKKPQTVFQLFYGRHPLLTMQPPSTFSLNPGETLTVSIPASSVSLLRERLSRVEGEIARIGIYTMQVGYADGTRWNFDGQNLPARNRTSMLRRPAEAETEHSFAFVGDALADQISMRSSYTYELPFYSPAVRPLFNSQEFGQCYNTQGDEPYLCVVSPSCYGTRQNWHNPYPNQGSYTIVSAPVICTNDLYSVCGVGSWYVAGSPCGGGFGCDPEFCDSGYFGDFFWCECLPI